jgi:hypothetical protein
MTHQSEGEGVQGLEQGVQRGDGIVVAVLALQSSPVESDIPIRQLVDEVEQTRHDGVQSVGYQESAKINPNGTRLTLHLLFHMLDQRLTPRQDPPVHHVLRLGRPVVIHKPLAVRALVQFRLGEEEAERVDPLADDGASDFTDAFVLEREVVATDDGRVDEVETARCQS